MSDMSNYSDPSWLNKGDNGWQLTAASLVALQSFPGLVILYAGMVKRKWAINSAFMALYAFAAVFVCWVIWAYKMGFGEQWGKAPFVGRPGPILTIRNEIQQALLPASGDAPLFPMATMAYFQFVFAAITVVIMAGAFLGRMNILAWMVFVPLWVTFSYTVGAFSLWGGGFLQKLGVIDYSGGYVIHLSSGTAGFVGAKLIGPRLEEDIEDFKAHNILLMLVGAGILWIGWNGFNGGDPYAASADAAVAVLNTNAATAMSTLAWIVQDIVVFKKPSMIGAVQGMMCGLVAITPAAGVIDGWAALIVGLLSGTLPFWSMHYVFPSIPVIRDVDDTLSVFQTHALAGFIGGMSVGVFATKEGCTAFRIPNPGGAIDGNWRQLWIQLVGAIFIFVLNVVMTTLILIVIMPFIPLRMSEEDLLEGDNAIHGEDAYIFGQSSTSGGRPIELGTMAGSNPIDVERGGGRSTGAAADGEIDGSPNSGIPTAIRARHRGGQQT